MLYWRIISAWKHCEIGKHHTNCYSVSGPPWSSDSVGVQLSLQSSFKRCLSLLVCTRKARGASKSRQQCFPLPVPLCLGLDWKMAAFGHTLHWTLHGRAVHVTRP